MAEKRLIPLDTLRGFAALSVLVWHYRTAFKATPLATVLAPFYESGGYAVVFFFLLSGYVLSHVYIREYRHRDFWGNLRARLARMGPLHYATLLLVAAVEVAFRAIDGRYFVYDKNDAYHFFLNLTFLQQSGLQHGLSFNGPSWSISAEMIANVAFLALICLRRRWIVAGSAVLSAVALAMVLASSHYTLAAGDLLYSALNTPIDSSLLVAFATFFFGAVLYQAAPPSPVRSAAYDLAFVLGLAVSLVLMAWRGEFTSAHFDLVLAFVAFPVLIVCSVRGVWTARALSSKPVRWLGYISFSLYLTHFLVQCAFHAVGLPFESPIVFASFILCALTVAVATARCFEWPVYRWLKGLTPPSLDGGEALLEGRLQL